MREEGRPGGDVYAWHDPHEGSGAQAAAPVEAEPATEVVEDAPAAANDEAYAWRAPEESAPAQAEEGGRPRRARSRSRSRSRAAPAEVQGVSEAPEAVAEASPPEPPGAEEPAAEAPVELVAPEVAAPELVKPQPEPEAESPSPPPTAPAANEAVREPDPAEITGQPAAPRRGWWRRGG
jgi:ribonuclease E